MKENMDLLKLSSRLHSVDSCVLKYLSRYIDTCSNIRTTVVLIQQRELTLITFYDETHTTDIKNAIKLGNSKDIVSLKDLQDSPTLLEVYKEKQTLLIVKFSGNTFLIRDKNNCGFITSVIKTKLKNLIVLERSFELAPTKDGSTNFPIGRNVTLIPVCDKTCETTTKQGSSSKILPQRQLRGVTKVLPMPLEDSIRESTKQCEVQFRKNTDTCTKQRVDQKFNVLLHPFHGIAYTNSISPNDNVKQSIEATDGATSMTSIDCFASNVSRYRPTTYLTSTPKTQNSPLSKTASRPAAKYKDLENYENRQETFLNTDWDKYPNRPDIGTLLNWGFFYTGRADLVRCYHCGIGLKDWSTEDVVEDEHVRHSADCDFLKQKLGQAALNRIKIRILYETDGGINPQYASISTNQVPVVTTNSRLNRIDSANPSPMVSSARSSGSPVTTATPKSGINKNATPTLPYSVRHSAYQTVESRIVTFNNFQNKKQDPRKLSIAGFFYTGQGDVCRCFCCDGGMQHWDVEDEPVREHAKYFPTCSYIRQIKGEEYIKTVRLEAGMKDETETTSRNKNTQVNRPPSTAQLDKDPKNKGGRKTDHADKSDAYRSKIVQNVLASGFNQNQVKLAVDALLKRGTKIDTEDDLVNEILDNQEPENQLGSDVSATDTEDVLQENQLLKDFLKCMLCKIEETNILFLPCAHHKVCLKCAEGLKKCPYCSKGIDKKIKTYLS